MARAALLAASVSSLIGCHRGDDDLREWRPSDHKHTTDEQPESRGSETATDAPQVTGSAQPTLPGLDPVTIATWQRACMNCHGQLGRGDGPQGAMVQARDLSDPAWQKTATDAEITEAITKGRGRMPAFPLPLQTVDGLVHLVRLFNRDRAHVKPPASPSPEETASANAAAPTSPTPSSSPTPSTSAGRR